MTFRTFLMLGYKTGYALDGELKPGAFRIAYRPEADRLMICTYNDRVVIQHRSAY